ncbi:MAG: hypothetical protein AAGJ55_05990, partial [Cyanobacteria bacterium J06555_12]
PRAGDEARPLQPLREDPWGQGRYLLSGHNAYREGMGIAAIRLFLPSPCQGEGPGERGQMASRAVTQSAE